LLNQTQKDFYRENGYLALVGLISPAECDELARAADVVADGHYSNILNLHLKSEAFHRLVVHPSILTAVDEIQGARMIPIGSIFFFCKPGNDLEKGSAWHQDNYAPKAPYGSYLVAAVALDDADEANGSLIVYPGTHKLGDLPSKPSKNFEFDASGKIVAAYPIGNEVQVPPGYAPVRLKYLKGTVLILHGHIVHGADANPSPTRWRRKIYQHYIKDGDPFWPGWNARRALVERT
jgi:ectoine hydroxylase-related dioxygenase (phytanoyl-CoA dioxygenase family)